MSKHGVGVEVIERSATGIATQWLAECGCKRKWAGPTYEYVEDCWREHVHAETGLVTKPAGNKDGRWTP